TTGRCCSPTPRTRRSTSTSTSRPCDLPDPPHRRTRGRAPGPAHLVRGAPMYSKDGQNYYIVDGHVHFWDGSPANQKNRYGKGFTDCFYDYHRNLSPEGWVWNEEKFGKYSEEDMISDLFETGYVDKAIFQPTYLTDFYV